MSTFRPTMGPVATTLFVVFRHHGDTEPDHWGQSCEKDAVVLNSADLSVMGFGTSTT